MVLKQLLYKVFFTLTLTLSASIGKAQSSITLLAGISADLNNPHYSFYHIPLSFQWKPFDGPGFPLIIEISYGLPFDDTGYGNAYTLNPSLPGEVTLQKKIRPYLFTISTGFSNRIYTDKKNNTFSLELMPLCFSSQHFKVTYKNYDPKNYEILNPDVTTKTGGIVLAAAVVYNFHQHMVVRLRLQSPLLRKRGDYPLSYRYAAPLGLSFGYTIIYHHTKKG